MAFFDELSQIGQGAIKKTKEMSEAMRLSGVIREEEGKIQVLYKQIGEICFQNMLEANNKELSALYNEVYERKTRIQQCQEELREMKKAEICLNCGAEIPADSKFCNNCGAKIVRESISQPSVQATKPMTCPVCDAQLEEGQIFCTNCGTKIERPEGGLTARNKDVEQTRICANCGAVLKAGEKFCTQCGQTCESNESVQRVNEVPTCPNCGKELEKGQLFCTSCGTRVG